jgi:hypothetical protein
VMWGELREAGAMALRDRRVEAMGRILRRSCS